MIKVCAILLISLVYGTVEAQSSLRQTPFQLYGKVMDTAGNALSDATVQFVGGKDTISTMTGEDGRFTFSKVWMRRFRLYISMKGYRSLVRSFAAAEGRPSVQVGQIILRTNYNELEPVTISRVRPISIGEDTVSYHAAAFPVRDGADIQEILKRLPGIEVDIEGNVIVQGKKIEKVLVNGKEFFGGDLLLAIQNLPANVVDKLQVIDDYGDKARLTGVKSGDAAKVLNIVLKADKRNMDILHGEAGDGNGDRYLSDASVTSIKGERQLSTAINANNNSAIGEISVRNGRFNDADQWNQRWGGSIYVNAGEIDSSLSSSLLQENFYPGEQFRQYQITQTKGNYTYDSLKAVVTFKPDAYSLLRLTPGVRWQKSVDQQNDSFSTLQQDSGFSRATTGISQNKSRVTVCSVGNDLYFERLSPHSRRRFSVEIFLYYKDNRQSQDNLTSTTVVTDSVDNSLTHYLVSNDASSWHASASANYYLPTGQSSFLELGAAALSDVTRTGRLTQEAGAWGLPIRIDSLSQGVFFRKMSQQWHTGYSGRAGPLQFSLGLDLQPGSLEGTADAKGDLTAYHFLSWLPLAQTIWTISSRQKVLLNYRGSSTLPTLQQVSPVTDLTNPQYPVTGNPGLKPSFIQSYGLHYEMSALKTIRFFGYGVGLAYSTTKDPIIPYTIYPKDSSGVVQRTTYVNAGSSSTIKLDYHVTLPAILDNRLRISISGNLGRGYNMVLTDSLRYTNITWISNQLLHVQWLIQNVIELNVIGNYSYSKVVFPGSNYFQSAFHSTIASIQIKNHICRHWTLNNWLGKEYISTGGKFLTSQATLAASLQRESLAHNRATVSLKGYNLLNSAINITQTSSATGMTQAKQGFSSRYFLLCFALNLSRLRN